MYHWSAQFSEWRGSVNGQLEVLFLFSDWNQRHIKSISTKSELSVSEPSTLKVTLPWQSDDVSPNALHSSSSARTCSLLWSWPSLRLVFHHLLTYQYFCMVYHLSPPKSQSQLSRISVSSYSELFINPLEAIGMSGLEAWALSALHVICSA